MITIMVLGHWLEMRAIAQARGALTALAALLPDTAERVTGAEVHTVPYRNCTWVTWSWSGREPAFRRMAPSSKAPPMWMSR